MKDEIIHNESKECPECKGTGKISSQNCSSCDATGQIIVHSHEHRHGSTLHDHPHSHSEPHHPDEENVPHSHQH